MSAIAGFYLLSGADADPEAAHRMSRLVAHRGAEQEVVSEGPVALVSRLHRTTATAQGGSVDAEGRYRMVADLRLDNREEVGRRLGLTPPRVASSSDEALALQAYVRSGAGGFSALVGDFALAIWDREQRTVTCARDPFGVRPLYYYHDPTIFAFASEPKALFALEQVPKRLNEAKLAEYLVLLREDPQETIYDGVFLLGAAKSLTVGPRGLRAESYYVLEAEPSLEGRSRDDLVEGFRARFQEGVTRCSRAIVPVGAYLSGGLDSSAVTCVARDVLSHRNESLHTFSAVYEGIPESDERPYIDAVVEQGGIVPHILDGTQFGPLSNLDDLYSVIDDEPVGGNQHIVWALLREAQKSGVGVLLDGLDGDNVVGHGLEYLLQLARAGEWGEFATLAPAVAQRFQGEASLQPFQHALRSTGRVFAQYGYPALEECARDRRWGRLARGVRGARRHLGVSSFQLARALARPILGLEHHATDGSNHLGEATLLGFDLVDSDLARRVDLRGRAEAAWESSLGAIDPADFRERQRRTLQHPVFTRGMTLTNLAAGAFGIESRHPFLYRPLVEYSLGLPPALSLHDGWTRYVLREALQDVLPETVRGRGGKADHTAAFVHTLTRFESDRLAAWVADPGPFGEVVQPERLRDLHRQATAADPTRSSPARTLLVQVYAAHKMLERKALLRSCGRARRPGTEQ